MTSSETAPAIAISATFTAEPVEESLRFWLDELGWRDALHFAQFNQVIQQLLDPASLPRTPGDFTTSTPSSATARLSGIMRSGWRNRLK